MKKISFKNRKILITGIRGFVGTHLAQKLQDLEGVVYGTSRTEESKSIIKTDLFDKSVIEKFVRKKKIDTLVHLAGISLVETGIKDPFLTFRTNTLGTLHVLEAARKNNVERVILASTVHVYGNNKLPFRETMQLTATRPYETSKVTAELMAQAYGESYDMTVFLPRFVNIYGPGDRNITRIIPRTIQTILLENNPTMWGKGTKREYLYIDDAVDAYVRLLTIDSKKVRDNRVFNFGTGSVVSTKDLMNKVLSFSEFRGKIIHSTEGREAEIPIQYVSSYKAKKILGWQPQISLEVGLKRTFTWYTNHFLNK